MENMNLQQRRRFLAAGCKSMLAFMLGSRSLPLPAGNKPDDPLYRDLSKLTTLQAADANGVRLPPGFRSRIIARSSQPVAGTGYVWHNAPDGGACFGSDDGGWVYVSNSEITIRRGGGGVSAVRFDKSGKIIDAYSILSGTDNNCAGGRTPWNTWLSCEEVDRGLVYECNPFQAGQGVVRPALGRFKHEAVTVDPVNQQLFLTEDEPDGAFYRFIPDNKLPDLSSGTLQTAGVYKRGKSFYVEWLDVPDSQAKTKPARYQVEGTTIFKGGEGIAWHDSKVYFTTKGDNRVWSYNTDTQQIEVLYDAYTSPTPHLKGVDNVAITATGDVLVAEDNGDMQIVLLTPNGKVMPVVQVVGHEGSEICGPGFDPAWQRLYFSSQRGVHNRSHSGITYEISRLS